MQNIPLAMTWELFARGRWNLLAVTLAAASIPAILFAAIQSEGLLHPDDQSMVTMHVFFILFNATVCGSAIFSAQGEVARLYSLPIRTSAIVVCRLLPAMGLIAIQTVVIITLLNTLYNLEWPIWGPVVFVAVGFAAVEAVVWLTERSVGWMLTALAAVFVLLGLWFQARYGAPFSAPATHWKEVTLVETTTLISFAMAAYWAAVVGVGRNRRGEPPLSLGWIDALRRQLARLSAPGVRLTTPAHAHQWFEWRRKGFILPVVVVLCLTVGTGIWLLVSRNPEDLFQMFISGGGLLTSFGLIGGLIFGSDGTNQKGPEMGSFLATRPLADSEMARIVLRTAAKSVLLVWAIWAIAFATTIGFTFAMDQSNVFRLPGDWGWWYFPATLLGFWVTCGVTTSVVLAGRTKLITQIFCIPLAAIIMVMFYSKYMLAPETRGLFHGTLLAALAVAILIGTTWLYWMARQRLLVPKFTLWAAGGMWLLATVLVYLQPPNVLPTPLVGHLLVAATFALAALPLAAAPLALAWNRHR